MPHSVLFTDVLLFLRGFVKTSQRVQSKYLNDPHLVHWVISQRLMRHGLIAILIQQNTALLEISL